eukprot:CFRG1242T1
MLSICNRQGKFLTRTNLSLDISSALITKVKAGYYSTKGIEDASNGSGSNVELPTRPLGDILQLNRGVIHNYYGQRTYEYNGVNILSVTSVLQAARVRRADEHDKLSKWKLGKLATLGAVGYRELCWSILNNGIQVHKFVEDYLCGRRTGDLSKEEKKSQDFVGCVKSLSPVLSRITKVLAVESDVFSMEKRVAGRIDCIAEIDGQCVVVDWKTTTTTRRKETLEQHYESPIQLAAYVTGIKHDAEYSNIQVAGALIVTCFTNGTIADMTWMNEQDVEVYATQFEECLLETNYLFANSDELK